MRLDILRNPIRLFKSRFLAGYARCLFFFFIIHVPLLFAFDPFYKNYSIINQQSTAVAVIAFNRPQYLTQLIASLEKNPEAGTLPFFFFLDGGERATQAENISLIQQSQIKQKEIIARARNYGCPKNHIDSKEFLFEWCGFDRVIVIEEDLVVSRSYLKTLLNLYDWAERNYDNIGTVQIWSTCYLSPPEKQQQLPLVQETAPGWCLVSYCMGKRVWEAIAPTMKKYISFIDRLPNDKLFDNVRSKPRDSPIAPECKNWIKRAAERYDRQSVLRSFGSNARLWHSKYDFLKGILNSKISLNQDVSTCRAIWFAGYTRLQTVVNRAIHIGLEGISGGNALIQNYARMKLDEFPEDPELTEFTIAK